MVLSRRTDSKILTLITKEGIWVGRLIQDIARQGLGGLGEFEWIRFSYSVKHFDTSKNVELDMQEREAGGYADIAILCSRS